MAYRRLHRREYAQGVLRRDPAPAVTPPPGNPRYPLIDAARAAAAGMIVMYHVAGMAGVTLGSSAGRYFARLNMGVALFFLISGFLLYRPFLAARVDGRPPIRGRDFARRRLLRIVPGYWVALTVLGLWPGLVGLWHSGWWHYYVFGQNYSRATNLGGISSAWSLCVEMSFYVALPFLAAGLARLSRGLPRARVIQRELVALGILAAASVAFNAFVYATAPMSFSLSTLPALMDWFAYGMILAVISVAWQGREFDSRVLRNIAQRPWFAWALCALVFLASSTILGLPVNPFATYSPWQAVAEHAAYALAGILLLLPAVFCDGSGGWPRRLLGNPVLSWFGLVSYGVFLYHGPLLGKLKDLGATGWITDSKLVSLTVVTLVATTAAAAASYYLIERPVLRLKDRGRSRQETTATTSEASAPLADA